MSRDESPLPNGYYDVKTNFVSTGLTGGPIKRTIGLSTVTGNNIINKEQIE